MKYLWMKSKFSSIKEQHSLHYIEYWFQEDREYTLKIHYSCANLLQLFWIVGYLSLIWQFVNMVNNLGSCCCCFGTINDESHIRCYSNWLQYGGCLNVQFCTLFFQIKQWRPLCDDLKSLWGHPFFIKFLLPI